MGGNTISLITNLKSKNKLNIINTITHQWIILQLPNNRLKNVPKKANCIILILIEEDSSQMELHI